MAHFVFLFLFSLVSASDLTHDCELSALSKITLLITFYSSACPFCARNILIDGPYLASHSCRLCNDVEFPGTLVHLISTSNLRENFNYRKKKYILIELDFKLPIILIAKYQNVNFISYHVSLQCISPHFMYSFYLNTLFYVIVYYFFNAWFHNPFHSVEVYCFPQVTQPSKWNWKLPLACVMCHPPPYTKMISLVITLA